MGKTLAEIKVGDSASIVRIVRAKDAELFGEVTGDMNPLHFDEDYAQKTVFRGCAAHGMLIGSYFSAIFGSIFPGEGSIYLSQELKFLKPVRFGDEITATVTVEELVPDKNRVVFNTTAKNQDNVTVIVGKAVLMPPVLTE